MLVSAKTNRYFDRSFILVPSPPGSKAALSGWPAQIINDIIIVRPQVLPDAVKRLETKHRGRSDRKVKTLVQIAELCQLPNVRQRSITLYFNKWFAWSRTALVSVQASMLGRIGTSTKYVLTFHNVKCRTPTASKPIQSTIGTQFGMECHVLAGKSMERYCGLGCLSTSSCSRPDSAASVYSPGAIINKTMET
jgi:hypothetical protein